MEVIYAAMPALLYLNPSILFYLLKPLLNFQSSQRYQNAYASPDLGMFLLEDKLPINERVNTFRE